MQYSLAIIVIVLVFFYVLYRLINFLLKTNKYFINYDDSFLMAIYVGNDCYFSFDDFRSVWIKVSKNLGCPDGKMVRNCKLSLLIENYPFPENFVDDIFMEFENYSEFSIKKEMSFGEFIISLCKLKNKVKTNA